MMFPIYYYLQWQGKSLADMSLTRAFQTQVGHEDSVNDTSGKPFSGLDPQRRKYRLHALYSLRSFV
jgi:hypothetical protein